MAGFIENMFYKPQGTIYHKFIHSTADCCFNVEYWISVCTSAQAKKGGESKAVLASLHVNSGISSYKIYFKYLFSHF